MADPHGNGIRAFKDLRCVEIAVPIRIEIPEFQILFVVYEMAYFHPAFSRAEEMIPFVDAGIIKLAFAGRIRRILAPHVPSHYRAAGVRHVFALVDPELTLPPEDGPSFVPSKSCSLRRIVQGDVDAMVCGNAHYCLRGPSARIRVS